MQINIVSVQMQIKNKHIYIILPRITHQSTQKYTYFQSGPLKILIINLRK